jgi:amphi-Trp domain-containing protein
MVELKFERKDSLSRQEAVRRLRAIADALDGNDRRAELELGSETIDFPVASDVRFELEVELDDDELELEIELKWSVKDAAPKAPSGSSRQD